MGKKKSKSYVQMKEKNNKKVEHDVLNPLKEYEYVEPPKKFPIKKFLLLFFCFIAIILIIVFFALIDKKTAEMDNNNTNNNYSSNNTNKKTTTTTTTTTTNQNTTTTTTKQETEEKSNQSLVCHTTTVDGDLEITAQVTANFYNNQLKSDINYMSVKLTNENSRALFDNYVITLQMFAVYLSDEETYDVSETTTDNEFILSITTTYSENEKIESNLYYNESYESVKQKLIDLGHTCE